MNPRIQELAYQAEDYANYIVDQGGEFHLAYTQKFAELIVKECAEVVDNHFESKTPGYPGDKIKENFGVEK